MRNKNLLRNETNPILQEYSNIAMFQKVVVLLFIFTEGRISHSDQVAGGPGHVNGA